jgi:hypothetical protein
MRKLFAFLLVFTIVFTACQKNEPTNAPPVEVEVEFVINQTDFGTLKSTDDVPLCVDDPWVEVEFTINGVTYTSPIFTVGGMVLTQAIKLPVGTYTMTYFVVKNASGEIVRAAPLPTTEFHHLMENPLDLTIEVEGFIKKQLIIDVLCYEDLYFEAFGFTWFELNDVKIERQCFFGDICTGKLGDFAGSEYAQQQNGVQMDMPAIMKIATYKMGDTDYEFLTEFDNFGDFSWSDETQTYSGFMGEGACMEVYWANDLDLTEQFKFELYVWLPVGGVFDWVLVHVWEFLDENCPDPGQDGVVDFVLGTCQQPDADLLLPPWMDLPLQITANISYPGALPSYWDVNVTATVPDGDFEFDTGLWNGWCADQNTTIGQGQHTFYVFSSLLPSTWPQHPAYLTGAKMNKINWLVNKLQDLLASGHGIMTLSSGEGTTLQNAFWHILHGTGSNTLSAAAASHPDYYPPPGGWAAVLLFTNPVGQGYNAQLLFVQVDP